MHGDNYRCEPRQQRPLVYRLQAELARRRSATMADVSARAITLELAKTLNALADIEERIAREATENKDR